MNNPCFDSHFQKGSFASEYEKSYREEDAYSQKNIQELIREVYRHREAISRSGPDMSSPKKDFKG